MKLSDFLQLINPLFWVQLFAQAMVIRRTIGLKRKVLERIKEGKS